MLNLKFRKIDEGSEKEVRDDIEWFVHDTIKAILSLTAITKEETLELTNALEGEVRKVIESPDDIRFNQRYIQYDFIPYFTVKVRLVNVHLSTDKDSFVIRAEVNFCNGNEKLANFSNEICFSNKIYSKDTSDEYEYLEFVK
jgi:hypothetical protein